MAKILNKDNHNKVKENIDDEDEIYEHEFTCTQFSFLTGKQSGPANFSEMGGKDEGNLKVIAQMQNRT